MKILRAKPFSLQPLDIQIINAGGRGFNSDVLMLPVYGSLSTMYVFKTDEGLTSILSPNEACVMHIKVDKHYSVLFDGNTGEFNLVENIAGDSEYSLKLVRRLGRTLEEAKSVLQQSFPHRASWPLKEPELHSLSNDTLEGADTMDISDSSLVEQNDTCPFCYSGDIEGGSVNIDARKAEQQVACNLCDKEWVDTYQLRSRTPL